MKNKVIAMLIILQLLVSSCGGVIGHIDYYEFNVSQYELENAIKTVMNEYPELNIPKGGKYTYENDSFTWKCFIKDENGGEVFSYKFYGDSLYWQEHPHFSGFSLIAMAEYGEILDFQKSFFPTTKWRMVGKFEHNFVDRVRAEIELQKP